MGAPRTPALGHWGVVPSIYPAPREGIWTTATSSPSGEPPAQHTPAAWAHHAGSGAAAGSGPPGVPRWGGSCWPKPERDIGAGGWVTCTPHLQECPSHAAHLQVRAATRWRIRHVAATRDSPQEGRSQDRHRGILAAESFGTRALGFLFTSSAWVCGRVTHRDLQLSQVTGGTASPGSADAG